MLGAEDLLDLRVLDVGHRGGHELRVAGLVDEDGADALDEVGAAHQACTHDGLLGETLGQGAVSRALDEVEGDEDRGRAGRGELLAGGVGPRAGGGGEAREDLGDRIAAEDVGDLVERQRRVRGDGAEPGEGTVEILPREEGLLERPHRLGRHEVRREPDGERIARADPRGGHAHELAEAPRQAAQQVGGADIGEEADRDLGHGDERLLRDHAVRAVDRDAHAATHVHAVDERDHGLGELREAQVHVVLVAEEGREVLPRHHLVTDGADVAAGAVGLGRGGGDEDAGHGVVGLPFLQRRVDRVDHVHGERVERLRTVQLDVAGAPGHGGDDLGVAHNSLLITRISD
ncbi:hypothetical protein MTP03_09630 [Tsukamurella sp. PLM1]|nr:hypothetical protein MTP03_09630 [Tsukamurella sp. PLM1]